MHEILYVQNYLPGLNGHTWSLAVEEQFYISFAILFYLAFKFKWLEKKTVVISVLLSLMLMVVVLRMISETGWTSGFIESHNRMDGILCGVLASYLFYFTNSIEKIYSHSWIALFISLGLISPIVLYHGVSREWFSVSQFAMNLGFALLVCLAWNPQLYGAMLKPRLIKFPFKIIAFVGVHSYSIYLWHALIKKFLILSPLSDKWAIVLYFILTIGLGIIISILIEQPILKFRNRVFK